MRQEDGRKDVPRYPKSQLFTGAVGTQPVPPLRNGHSLCYLAYMHHESRSSSFSVRRPSKAQREPGSKSMREVPTVSPNSQCPCDSAFVSTPPGKWLQARCQQPFPSVICVITLGWILGLNHKLPVSPMVFHSCLDQGCTEVITTELPTAEPAPLTKDKALTQLKVLSSLWPS